MVELQTGNILEADVEALVNTVNTVGVMGKGVALQFRQAFPENYEFYRNACQRSQVQPGKMLIYSRNRLDNPRFIINFPTKRHWKGKSKLNDIDAGLAALVRDIRDLHIQSIAIPTLGCGNGGLDWAIVRPRIIRALEAVPDVQVLLYEPRGAPVPDQMRVDKAAQYDAQPRRASKSDGQLRDSRLQRIEGHFIRGYGDRSREASIHLLPGAIEEARAYLADDTETAQRLERVSALIEGFETPRNGTVSNRSLGRQARTRRERRSKVAIRLVHEWSDRKRRTFSAPHILATWSQLRRHDWF